MYKFLRNPEKKLLKLISMINKVVGYKSNIKTQILFLYFNNR